MKHSISPLSLRTHQDQQVKQFLEDLVAHTFHLSPDLCSFKFRIEGHEEATSISVRVKDIEFLPKKPIYCGDELVMAIYAFQTNLFHLHGARVVEFHRNELLDYDYDA